MGFHFEGVNPRYWNFGFFTHLPSGFAGEPLRGGGWAFCFGPFTLFYSWES
jgi:hypothetical protein